MAAISQTIFPDAFSRMKSFKFWLKIHWSLFLKVQLTITNIGLDNGLGPNRRQAIIWTNADQINWRTYAALGGEISWCINSLIGFMVIIVLEGLSNSETPISEIISIQIYVVYCILSRVAVNVFSYWRT